jgi:hypothetical protein
VAPLRGEKGVAGSLSIAESRNEECSAVRLETNPHGQGKTCYLNGHDQTLFGGERLKLVPMEDFETTSRGK